MGAALDRAAALGDEQGRRGAHGQRACSRPAGGERRRIAGIVTGQGAARWFTPEHNSVAPDGVQPDEVVAGPEDRNSDEDPQLDRALELLGG